MEESKKEAMKPTYEQLKQIAFKLQQRAIQAEASLDAFSMTTARLKYLFDVLDRARFFSSKFVDDCIAEITDILEVKKEEKEDDSFVDSSK